MKPRFGFVGAEGPDLRAPVAGELLREPVADAPRVPCERCGAVDWWRVERRADPSRRRTRQRALGCAGCGRMLGGWQEAGRLRRHREPEPVDPFADVPDPGTPAEAAALAGFPVYAPGGRVSLRMIGAREGGEVEVVTVGTRSLEVTSRPPGWPPDPEELAREALSWPGEWWSSTPHLSEDAWRIHHAARSAAREHEVAAAPAEEVVIAVEGRPTPFLLVRVGEDWAAAARLPSGGTVTVTGNRKDPARVALERVR